MPYLADKTRRLWLQSGGLPDDGAELNYLVSYLADKFVQTHGLSYHTLEEIVGALESAKAEFQRRIVGPYEEIKLRDSGEVYEHTATLLRELRLDRARKIVADGTGSLAAELTRGL